MTQSTRSTSTGYFARVTGVRKRSEQQPGRHRAVRRPRSDLDLLAEHFPALAQHTATTPPAMYRASSATPTDITAPLETAHRTTAREIPVPNAPADMITAVLPRVPQQTVTHIPTGYSTFRRFAAYGDVDHAIAEARGMLRDGANPTLLADALAVWEGAHPEAFVPDSPLTRPKGDVLDMDEVLERRRMERRHVGAVAS